MNKIDIEIPENVRYISEWTDFEDTIKAPKAMIDKGVCGCGFTNYYLTCPMPIILCEPRKYVLKNKAAQLKGVYYYEPSGSTSKNKQELENLQDYMTSHVNFKVLITYDSFANLASFLCNFHHALVVADEVQALFEDYLLKNEVVERFLTSIKMFRNVRYITATPIYDTVLEQIDVFKKLPMYVLHWATPTTNTIHYHQMKSPEDSMSSIIADFKSNGYFAQKEVQGNVVYATEGVFYLNDVSKIISIIKTNGIQPGEVNILCADTEKNAKKLKGAGLGFGNIPLQGKPNKPFTFCTSTSFYGVDFYSDCAATFIFISTITENLLLDPSLDVKQILGRQRNPQNQWKDECFLYLSITRPPFVSRTEYKLQQATTQAASLRSIGELKQLSQSTLATISLKQPEIPYGVLYQNPFSDKWVIQESTFAKYIEERNWWLMNMLYTNHTLITNYLRAIGFNVVLTTSTTPAEVIMQELSGVLKVGEKYSQKDLKQLLQNAYNRAGIKDSAKGSDIEAYCNVKRCNMLGEDGKQHRGFIILVFNNLKSN